MLRFVFSSVLFLSLVQPSYLQAKENLLTGPLAEAFGKQPLLKSVRLSPDGRKISYIRTHPSGVNYLQVTNLDTGNQRGVLTSIKDKYELSRCDWANNQRLLCTAYLADAVGGRFYPKTRLIGVNDDASDAKVLLKRRSRNIAWSQFQSDIVDWLPDDPDHVLVQLSEGVGVTVQTLNVYDGTSIPKEHRRKNIWDWMSDGTGTLRLYHKIDYYKSSWLYKPANGDSWEELDSQLLKDGYSTFQPVGFGASPNDLLYFDYHKGRQGLFVMDLSQTPAKKKMVYVRPDVDISGVYSIGKRHRIVAASYDLERTYLYFFDEALARVHAELSHYFDGKDVYLVDEDWQQRYYIVYVTSDTDAGQYHYYDSKDKKLQMLSGTHPALDDYTLATMTPVEYLAKDGTTVSGYLTLPVKGKAPFPTVVLPHGGPASRDIAEFDFLVQFLAAKGYAVLQSNYRGSSGFGAQWEGQGAFKQWRQAVSDIVDGAKHFVAEGIVDKTRICAVGWSYGGYAALMSAIENPDMFQCVTSIAGVTDPKELADYMRNFIGGRAARVFIGMEDEVTVHGSPVERASELTQPLMIVQPHQDSNVPYRQAEYLVKQLKKAKKDYQYIEYKYAEHSIRPERYRIDMLARLGQFLDEHLKAARAPDMQASSRVN